MAVTPEELYAIYRQHPTVCTDTRQLTPGCLFFALKGAAFDGNRFAEKALEQGAAFAVVDDPALQGKEKCLFVPDTLVALQDTARLHRRSFDIPVIGIGGSNGKTTTKELVSAVLSSHYPCHYTKGNLNNHIGVPLTLLAMPAQTEVAVIEMGANHPGEIDELCRIALPTHGLITNIGKEHLEGFGSLEGVKKAEGELYRYIAETNGWIFVNASEKYLSAMSRRNRRKIIYGRSEAPNQGDLLIDIQLLRQTPFVAVSFLSDEGETFAVESRLFGLHNFNNIMTAIALGLYFKTPPGKIKAAIENYTPANNRSQIVERDGNTYIMDAYNANPSSMAAAIESSKAMEAHRKVAIMGDMLELGADSPKEHEAALKRALKAGFDYILLVGAEFGACKTNKAHVLQFPDTATAKNWLQAQHFRDTLFLVKGSRGIRLEGILA